tara:strand:- start:112 stop:1011 length:900 start_codon:yes stop_codon:yes gene_type:complete
MNSYSSGMGSYASSMAMENSSFSSWQAHKDNLKNIAEKKFEGEKNTDKIAEGSGEIAADLGGPLEMVKAKKILDVAKDSSKYADAIQSKLSGARKVVDKIKLTKKKLSMKVNPDDEGEGTELTDISNRDIPFRETKLTPKDSMYNENLKPGEIPEASPGAGTEAEVDLSSYAGDATEIGEVGQVGVEAGIDAGIEGAGEAIDMASAGLEVASGGLATGIALAGGFVGTGLMVLGSLAGVGGAVSSVASIVADSGMTKADDWIEKNVFHHTLNAPKLPEPSSIGQIAQSAVLPVFDRSTD